MIRVAHIGHVKIPPEHPDFHRAIWTAHYPGQWVLNLAMAQKAHADILPHIFVKVPGAKREWSIEMQGIPIHFVPVPKTLQGKTFFLASRYLMGRAVERFRADIVHAHGTEEFNALAALRCSAPKTLTLQGCYFLLNRLFPPRFFSRGWIVERLERRSIPRFEHIITKSRYIQKAVENEFPGINTHLIPNTYNSGLEDLGTTAKKAQTVAFVGSINKRKGFDTLVQAIELIETRPGLIESAKDHHSAPGKLQFVVIGNRPEVQSSFEESQLLRLRELLGDRVQFKGILSNLEVAREVAQCTVLAAPSIEEMFGNQVIEALLAGTPVIVTEGTAMAENVERFGGGQVIGQADPKALAEALVASFHNPPTVSQMHDVRDRVSAYMSPAEVARKHDSLYRLMLNEKPAG